MTCEHCERDDVPKQDMRELTLSDAEGILLDETKICVDCLRDSKIASRPNANSFTF